MSKYSRSLQSNLNRRFPSDSEVRIPVTLLCTFRLRLDSSIRLQYLGEYMYSRCFPSDS
jgi:hypothetical protein